MSLNIKFLLLFLITGLVGGLITSCATGPESGQIKSKEAESLFARGEYEDAAKLFTNLASQTRLYKRVPLLLRAAAAYARTGNIIKSKQLLQTLEVDTRIPQDKLLLALTHSHIALAERQADKLIEILNNNPPISGISAFYLADYFDLRADAYNLSGNRIETANELIL